MDYNYFGRCIYCDKEFIVRGYGQKYCNDVCNREHKKSELSVKAIHKELGKGVCLHCGDEYNKRQHHQKYCTNACSNSAKYERQAKIKTIRICHVCGKDIEGKGKKYCSKECSSKVHHERRRENEYKKHKSNNTKRICIECGDVFYSHTLAKYCNEHKHIGLTRGRKKQYKNLEPRIARCGYCKKDIMTTRIKRIYCSDECKHKQKEFDEMIQGLSFVFYALGFNINGIHYIKFGISNSYQGRFKRYKTSLPFILSMYHVREFDSLGEIIDIEDEILLKYINKQTESCNEWRMFTEDECIDMLIDLGGIDKGNEIKIPVEKFKPSISPRGQLSGT